MERKKKDDKEEGKAESDEGKFRMDYVKAVAEAAIGEYESALEDLKTFLREETCFKAKIDVLHYPISVELTPASQQQSLFDSPYAIKEGETETIVLTMGQTTTLSAAMRFRLDSNTLKKIIKKSNKVGTAYLHAFRAAAQVVAESGDTEIMSALQKEID